MVYKAHTSIITAGPLPLAAPRIDMSCHEAFLGAHLCGLVVEHAGPAHRLATRDVERQALPQLLRKLTHKHTPGDGGMSKQGRIKTAARPSRPMMEPPCPDKESEVRLHARCRRTVACRLLSASERPDTTMTCTSKCMALAKRARPVRGDRTDVSGETGEDMAGLSIPETPSPPRLGGPLVGESDVSAPGLSPLALRPLRVLCGGVEGGATTSCATTLSSSRPNLRTRAAGTGRRHPSSARHDV